MKRKLNWPYYGKYIGILLILGVLVAYFVISIL